MKAILTVLALFVFTSAALAQKTNKNAAKQPDPVPAPAKDPAADTRAMAAEMLVGHFSRKYSVAQRWGDYDVAKDALYDLISEFPGNDSLIFTLAYFYFENQHYTSCAVVCNDLIARNSKNAAALELSAISYENLNIKDKALQNYESLFLLTNNNSNLYKMASLQYDLKRYGESLTNADILLSKPQVDSLNVVITDTKNNSKEHPLKAALFNLKGLTYKAQGDMANARKSFEEALKIDPAFEAAKQNLASLK
jgi:tetratricopeptide (TPR) repeat protein